jgi:uncharacterized membrane protein (GlpM family)
MKDRFSVLDMEMADSYINDFKYHVPLFITFNLIFHFVVVAACEVDAL